MVASHPEEHGRNVQFILNIFKKKKKLFTGTWVAQLVMHPTLDLGSGHDLMVCEFKPQAGLCADSVKPAWDSLSLSLCPSPARLCSPSVSQNKF